LHFLRCIQHGDRPITDGAAGLRVVRILEAATQSMKRQGQLVKLDAVEVAV
jgi:predicted dehydrogenase